MSQITNPIEQWQDILGYEGHYQVSDYGRVKSLKRIKQQAIDRSGYCKIQLWKGGKAANFQVHRLVAIVFIANPFNLPQINHINGIKGDNRCINLAWCSALDNMHHAIRQGLIKQRRSCLSIEDVIEIHKMWGTAGSTKSTIAKVFGCSIGHISAILNGHERVNG